MAVMAVAMTMDKLHLSFVGCVLSLLVFAAPSSTLSVAATLTSDTPRQSSKSQSASAAASASASASTSTTWSTDDAHHLPTYRFRDRFHRKSFHVNSASNSFPNSSSPQQSSPPIYLPSTVSCTLPIFDNVAFSGYGAWIKSTFTLADGLQPCPPSQHWAKLVLNFYGAVKGLQYDRVGAMWLGDVEILRLTTPEPTPAGIVWSAQQDLSALAGYVLELNSTQQGNIPAFVNIPNVVDSHYTGVIYVNATLSIYADSQFQWQHSDFQIKSQSEKHSTSRTSTIPAIVDPPNVFPLTRAPTRSADGLSATSISGPNVFNYTLPTSKFFTQRSYDGAPIFAQRLYAVLLVSQHGCDEFYYTNVPTEYAQQLSGGCGAGSYREINVTIDGLSVPAAVSSPFATIYTGGINPLLWRPLTGIQSFALTPVYLDVTPFMGTLVDGGEHYLSINLFPNNTGGNWYIDSSLLLYYSSTPQSSMNAVPVLIGGNILSHKDTLPYVSVTVTGGPILPNPVPPITLTTIATHSVAVSGILKYSNGDSEIVEVIGYREFSNINFFPDLLTQVVNNSEHTQIERSSPSFSSVLDVSYPMNLWSYYNQDATTFDMKANVDYKMQRSKQVSKQENGQVSNFGFYLDDHLVSIADYNRTLDGSVNYVEEDTANELFDISVNNNAHRAVSAATSHTPKRSQSAIGSGCYAKQVSAGNGAFLSDSVSNTCNDVLPAGVALCGYDICGLY